MSHVIAVLVNTTFNKKKTDILNNTIVSTERTRCWKLLKELPLGFLSPSFICSKIVNHESKNTKKTSKFAGEKSGEPDLQLLITGPSYTQRMKFNSFTSKLQRS